MKSKSLIKVIQHHDGGFHLTFFRPTFSLFYAGMNYEHTISVARRFLEDQIRYEAIPYIDSWSSQGKKVNCPEGCISLPADIWSCKLTDSMCSLQSSIDLDDKDEFIELCHAPKLKKEQIWNTVEQGKYKGFHHVPGRSLCICCEFKGKKKESFKYHYPWEFAELDVAILSSYEDTYRELQEREIPVNYVLSPICSECCYELAVKLRPDLKNSLQVIEINFDPRKKSV
ncbi:hypothetical protein OMR72_004614 [Vibrio parahaemolyticus]|uniref:hypothetical protein n=1 Tax=Vibrio TaxID=662 RepID=UPI000CD2B354|nr:MULTISPECIES: hypothetical protein [Vibrio]EJG1014306.1 hypothetical protein [Vibrio parahaemolyticus]EKA8936297.1 hypothetical protein [Vibrio parahaemolyticus]EKF6611955.1 hypothetical protein [Vibrio parahaemolyticus]ELI5882825.1 hypothetical protein [Vibrio parahaemolyticus]MDF4907370.1 hypothetical protein [Vibrio parahaemolyticus]